MAGVLHRFEQRLETAVTTAFARAFRSEVQPVEIASALQREVDNSSQVMSRNRRLAPNVFVVELSPTDHERLNQLGAALTRELATLIKEHAQEQRYTLAGPLEITLTESGELGTGRFRVRSRTNATVEAPTADPEGAVFVEIGGARHSVPTTGMVIGRGSEADLRIDDPGISRRHARIEVHGSGDGVSVTVADLESTNGVILNGQRVSLAAAANGSDVRLGNTTLTIRIDETGS